MSDRAISATRRTPPVSLALLRTAVVVGVVVGLFGPGVASATEPASPVRSARILLAASPTVPIRPFLHVQALVSPAFLNLGNSTSFTAVVTGAKPWLSYLWSALPPGCAGGNVSTFTCVPGAVGTYSVDVRVNDSSGRSATGVGQLVVNRSDAPVGSSPPHVTVIANPPFLSLGNATDLVAQTTGGRPWFSYSWSPLPPGCTTGNSSVVVCRPTSTGTFSARVTLTDSLGHVASNSTTVVVNGTSGNGPGGSSGGGPFNLGPSLFALAGVVGISAAVATALVIVFVLRRRPPPARPESPPSPPIPPSARLYVPPKEDETSTV